MSVTAAFSLIIIVDNHTISLQQLLKGVARSSVQPKEIIVVDTSDSLTSFYHEHLFVISIHAGQQDGKCFSLASARVLGATSAKYDLLCFLDVHCIPSCTFFEEMLSHSSKVVGLVMGQFRYLKKAIQEDWEEKDFIQNSERHLMHPTCKKLQASPRLALVWNKCFTIPKQIFNSLEGSSSTKQDNNLSSKCKKAGVSCYLAPSSVFHYNTLIPSLKTLNSITNLN